MQRSILLSIFIISCQFIYSQPPAGPASVGNTYGAKVSSDGVLPWTDVNKKLSGADTVNAKIEGNVLASCPKKGCWMEVELADKSKMFVKFKDYAFFVPTDIVGKKVILEGIAFNKETSVAELQHYAKDAKKSKAEIDAIKEPKKETRFLADGVLVVD